MIKIKRIIAAGALSIFAFSAVGCEMIQRTPESIKNTVVAKVGDVKITKGDVDEIADPYLKQYYGEDYASNTQLSDAIKEMRTQALNLLVEEKIILKKAEELGVTPTQEEIDEEVQKYIDSMKTNYGGDEGFNSALESAGMTLDEFKTNVTSSMKSQLATTKVTEEIFKDVSITDEEIGTYYEENKEGFSEANVSHILISDETKAKEVRERAVNGEDFATLAKELSEDTGTKEAGGSLGVVKYNSTQYVQEFMDGLKALKEGEISEPVKSQFGYHIIKATDVKNKTLEESKDTIKTTLENEKKNEVYKNSIEQWKKDYKVKTYEDKL
ncbi:peptidylprolyl isomerase [Clostridium sartagoforme AAU1]|uniref:peptidylprolyl isomerase n=1 Tax=Clostridium sartagoforme AAU1 TaxID=1202534 RepID=R9CBG7_9CLOT|nr:peptidylprolyl isomerase [Clostridium sartagoforme]EOR26652.1 peptidylprolyl isomerase [Clostridium sartagoforme AAU1]